MTTHLRTILAGLVVLVSLVGCGPRSSTPAAQPTVVAHAANTATPLLPASTKEPTQTATSRPTSSPTPTLTPTLAYPVSAQTPIPAAREVITSNNIRDVRRLVIYGSGAIQGLDYSPDGTQLALVTSTGYRILDANTMETICQIDPDPQRLADMSSNRFIQYLPGTNEVVTADTKTGRLWAFGPPNCKVTELFNAADWFQKDKVDFTFYPTRMENGTLLMAMLSGWGSDKLYLVDPARIIGSTAVQLNPKIYPPTIDYTYALISPDGKYIVGGGDDRLRSRAMLEIWDVKGNKVIFTRKEQGEVAGLALSPDGSHFAVIENGKMAVRLMEVATGLTTWQARVDSTEGQPLRQTSVQFAPDGKTIAVGTQGGGIVLISAKDGKKVSHLNGPRSWVELMRFSPDSSRLVTYSWDLGLQLWDLKTGQFSSPQMNDYYPRQGFLTLSPDDRFVANKDSGGVRVIDLQTNTVVTTLAVQESPSFSRDGKILATADEQGQNEIHFWSVPDFKPLKTIPIKAYSLAFHPDGKSLLIWEAGKGISIYSLAEDKVIRTIPGLAGRINISPDGNWVGLARGDITVFNLADPTIQFTEKEDYGDVPVFTPDSKRVFIPHKRDPKDYLSSEPIMLSLPELKPLVKADQYPDQFIFEYQMAVTPDGSMLAVSKLLRHQSLWQIGFYRISDTRLTPAGNLAPMGLPWKFLFTSDGKRLITTSLDQIYIMGLQP